MVALIASKAKAVTSTGWLTKMFGVRSLIMVYLGLKLIGSLLKSYLICVCRKALGLVN